MVPITASISGQGVAIPSFERTTSDYVHHLGCSAPPEASLLTVPGRPAIDVRVLEYGNCSANSRGARGSGAAVVEQWTVVQQNHFLPTKAASVAFFQLVLSTVLQAGPQGHDGEGTDWGKRMPAAPPPLLLPPRSNSS